ncbi:flotillin domain-containing protein [Streptomyces turgidiscabies]|uniref:Membrane protein YqiK n=1 Tax=Streptomyces turgidiscabies TaxID=85558 RepID=A0ABU0RKY1_9ACTN|nr:flotillin domain-containing protein [Streptomyces turgidiscabies]MDQ0932648.1 putative membrane protein YqiK [Streptomyces turgidiscabies]
MSSVVIAVVGVVVLLVLLALVVVTRYKVAGPSEAFIVTGRRGKKATDPETGRVFTDNSGQKVAERQAALTDRELDSKVRKPADAARYQAEQEAEAMRKKADAFGQYGDAAVLQMLVEVLPSVVAKASEPLSAIDKMTVISTDGASQLARTVADNVAQGVELLSSTTGVDLAELLKNVTQRGSVAQPAPKAPEAPKATAQANGKIAIAE